MGQWLVRTAKNVISGPYVKEALCQMILSGELGSQDEVCDSGSYWIFLHEREEVARQLGIHLPKPPKNADEETTETQTQTQTQTQTDAGLNLERTPVPMSVLAAEEEVEPTSPDDEPTEVNDAADLAEPPVEEDDGATQVMGTRASNGARPHAAAAESEAQEPAREAAPEPARTPPEVQPESAPRAAQPQVAGPKVVYRPMVLGEIERPSAWRMAIWILVIAAFFLAFWMLHALRR